MLNSFDLTPGLDCYSHLWMAVLRQAMDDATMPPNTTEAVIERREARVWLRDAGEHIGSVQWICDVLNIKLEAILSEFDKRLAGGGIKRRRRVVSATYHKKELA